MAAFDSPTGGCYCHPPSSHPAAVSLSPFCPKRPTKCWPIGFRFHRWYLVTPFFSGCIMIPR